jgi:cellulose synthase/poly-beta-1,6-N-acetylglucosamine synthase-like glycosyltransferase
MILWAVLGIGVLHCAVFLHVFFRFRSLPKAVSKEVLHSFSIIVPVRNEAATLRPLIAQLIQLDYPQDQFEIIVVDDASEDGTLDQLPAAPNLKILQLPEGKVGKKRAIELGVAHAAYDWIITTDGDCSISPTWLGSFNNALAEDVHLVVGPVRMDGETLLGRLQSYDFSLLIGYAASLVGMGIPSMSNGANLCYRKRTFDEVGGYNGNKQVPTGDDEFLLLKIVKLYPTGIRFNNDPRAVVSTGPKHTFADLLNQRKRWLSKWTLHKNPRIIASVLLTLTDNLAMLVCMLGVALGFLPVWLLGILVARWLVKGWFSARVNRLLHGRTHWLAAGLYEVLYPFYVVLLSFASIFGHYTWKGRTYP